MGKNKEAIVRSDGRGLGLALVSGTLSDREGSVNAESTSESGTVFVVGPPRFASGRLLTALPVS
jgi:K+-sensing histidine kinase KdpD